MKDTKRTCSLFILAILIFTSITGCGQAPVPEQTGATTVDTPSVEPTALETEAPTWADLLPEDVKFNGADFNIGWCSPFEMNECTVAADELSGDVVADAVWRRNMAVEQKLDIKISSEPLCQSWVGIVEAVEPLVLSGDCPFDAFCASAERLFRCSLQGFLLDLNEIATVDFSNPWWDTEVLGMYSLGSKSLYFASGDINYLDDYGISCLYFNKRLCADRSLDLPYDLVREGGWTFDKMNEYVGAFGDDLDGNGEMDENDLYGLVANCSILNRLLSSARESIILVDGEGNVSLNNSERMYDIISFTVNQFVSESNAAVLIEERKVGYDLGDRIFPEGRSLFSDQFVGSIVSLRGEMEDDFGVLPYPKYDETQEKYSSFFNSNWATGYALPSTASETERSGWILDVMGFYSVDTISPAVIEKNVKHRSLRDEDSADMLAILFDTKFFELGIWGTNIYNTLLSMVNSGKDNYSSAYASSSKLVTKEFPTLTEYYSYGN